MDWTMRLAGLARLGGVPPRTRERDCLETEARLGKGWTGGPGGLTLAWKADLTHD